MTNAKKAFVTSPAGRGLRGRAGLGGDGGERRLIMRLAESFEDFERKRWRMFFRLLALAALGRDIVDRFLDRHLLKLIERIDQGRGRAPDRPKRRSASSRQHLPC